MTNNQSKIIYTGGGDYREIDNQGTYVEGNYYNSPTAKQNLIQAAAEIQQLLKQLEQTYNADSNLGKMQIATAAIKQIEEDSDWKGRIVSALKAGGVGALDSVLNHPAASFIIEAVKDWQITEL